MPKAGFKYYALHYLNLWVSQDRPCYLALKGHHRERKLKALAKAAAVYGIARTLPGRDSMKDGHEKYRPLLRILEQQKRGDFRRDKLPMRIKSVNRQIMRKCKAHHQVLSLTTKFLWLKLQSPIIIYDSRARKALNVRPNDIEKFCREWRKNFKACKRAIRVACASLHKVHEYAENPEIATPQYIAKIAAKRWFRERVFDVYLWRRGGPKQQDS